MGEVVEGPFDLFTDAVKARIRIAAKPEWIRVMVVRGSEKPKENLLRDKYYVWATYMKPLYPPPAPPVTPAKKEDFIRDMTEVYKCGGKSEFLNKFCREENVEATLRVDLRVVDEIQGPHDEKPRPNVYEDVIGEWKEGKELNRRLHEPTGKWYWVTYPAVLSWVTKPKPPTPLRQAYIDYFENPDIITAIGLTPSAIHDSFSKVFSGYSVVDEKDMEPAPSDYIAVAEILGGVVLASAPAVYAGLAALPAVGGAGMMKGMAGVSMAAAPKGLTKIVMGIVASPYFKLAAGVSFILMAFWNLTDPLWWYSVFVKMSGDVKRRFEGLRIDVQTKLKQAYNLIHIQPDPTKLAEALNLLRVAKPLINDLFNMLSGLEIDKEIKKLYPEFEDQVKAFITQFNDLVKGANGTPGDYLVIGEMLIPTPKIPPTFPEEFLLEDVIVEDGDTLMWPGHPEAANRIRMIGIDTHEIETEAGKEEAEYLKSLIEHQQVTIKVTKWQGTEEEREKLIGRYGRLLGGVFLGDTDIVLAMLNHFGKAILTPTKWQDKYRWIDWDEYKKTAEGAVGPAVKEFKISVDSMPSNAKLFIDDSYTGHLTPSNQKELKDVMHLLVPGEHIFKATKGGKEGSIKATITDGANPAIMITLGTPGLEPTPPEEIEAPPVEVPEVPVEEFSINIESMPSNAKLYIDNIYTHHWTPSNTKELRDVMDLLTPGMHIIKVTKAGKAAEVEVEILPGRNEPIFLTLGVVGLPPPEVPPEEVVILPEQEAINFLVTFFRSDFNREPTNEELDTLIAKHKTGVPLWKIQIEDIAASDEGVGFAQTFMQRETTIKFLMGAYSRTKTLYTEITGKTHVPDKTELDLVFHTIGGLVESEATDAEIRKMYKK